MSGWEFIKWLGNENLFVIPLDPEKRWFRYHHLFQKLLVNQLNRRFRTEEIKALHAQAGAWLAENGIIEEALRHYLAGMRITTRKRLDQTTVTTLVGLLRDQAELSGVLNSLYDLYHLSILKVEVVNDKQPHK